MTRTVNVAEVLGRAKLVVVVSNSEDIGKSTS